MLTIGKKSSIIAGLSLLLVFGFQNCSKSYEIQDTNLNHSRAHDHDHEAHNEKLTEQSVTSSTYVGYCSVGVSQGIEYTPIYGIPVNRNGHTESHPHPDCRVKLSYIDQAVAVQISRWTAAFPGHATITQQSIINHLRATPVNLTNGQNYSVAYNNGTSIFIMVTQQNAFSPAAPVFCNNNSDPTSKPLIHEMDHILAKRFGFTYADNIGSGHQAGGTWNGYNINGSVISPAFNPQPAYQAHCLEVQQAPVKVSVTGRILDAYGRPVSSAMVTLVNLQTGESFTSYTATFGYYSFKDLDSGSQVRISVQSRRYTFNPVTIALTENMQPLNIVAQ